LSGISVYLVSGFCRNEGEEQVSQSKKRVREGEEWEQGTWARSRGATKWEQGVWARRQGASKECEWWGEEQARSVS